MTPRMSRRTTEHACSRRFFSATIITVSWRRLRTIDHLAASPIQDRTNWGARSFPKEGKGARVESIGLREDSEPFAEAVLAYLAE